MRASLACIARDVTDHTSQRAPLIMVVAPLNSHRSGTGLCMPSP